MFNSLFNQDPFSHLPAIPPALSYEKYFTPLSQPHHLPPRPQRQRHHHHNHNHSHYRHEFHASSSPSPPSYSSDQEHDQDLDADFYHHSDSDTSLRIPPLAAATGVPQKYMANGNGKKKSNMMLSPATSFHRTTVKLPQSTIEKLPATHTASSVLIIPDTLTPLHVRLLTVGAAAAVCTLRATVAGDMRFCDVVRQIVGEEHGQKQLGGGEVRAYVRGSRGEWQEPEACCRVSELVEQAERGNNRYVGDGRRRGGSGGELQVKIEIGGGAGNSVGVSGGRRGVVAWEREMGRAWEIRE